MHLRPRSLVSQWLLAVALTGLMLSSAVPGLPSSVRTSAAPLILTLQPDDANGTDAFLLDAHPTWNFGTNASLLVGHDASDGSLSRSLLAFNLNGLPANATVVTANLSLFASQGSGGVVQARRILAPWTEGVEGRDWVRVPITVRETAGVNRTLEPVVLTLPFAPGSIGDPARDLRVYADGTEIPSQVYRYSYSGPDVVSARLAFEASVGAYQSRTFYAVYSTNGTAVPAYRTQTWGASARWTYLPPGATTPWGASGVSVADLNGDGKLVAVFGGNDGYVYCVDANGTLVWRTLVSPGQSVPFTPQLVDMDGSGKLSVVVVTNAPSVARLNSTGYPLWNVPTSGILFSTPTLVDVNGDGVLDVLVGGNFAGADALDGRMGALVRTYPVGLASYSAGLADINGDGTPEIFLPGDDKALHAYWVNGTQIWAASSKDWGFLEGSVGIGDLNADGRLEVVTGDDNNNGAVIALDAVNGSTVWFNDVLGSYREGGQTLVDLNGDGLLEMLLGIFSGPLYELHGTDGAVVWSSPAGSVQAGSPSVADLTRGGSPDFVFLQGSTVLVFNRTGSLIHTWTITENNLVLRNQAQHPMISPAIADLSGSGTLDVIVPTGVGVQAFATGGLDHDWRTWGYNWNHTQRAWDGNSPDGAPFLNATVGVAQSFPALGASWAYRNGVTGWANPGGDFSVPEANATGAFGWMSWDVTRMVQDWHAGTFPNVGLVLTEANEASGPLHIFASSDSGNATQRPMLTITYLGNSVPRIVGRIPDQVRAENSPPWSISLQGYAADGDTPLTELRWNVTGFNPAVIQITGLNTQGNQILTIYPQTNAYGNNLVTYWLTDPEENYAAQQAWINITPVNQPPTFNPPPILFVHYNRTYTFDYRPYIADVDTPTPQLTLSADDPSHTAVSVHNVSYLYPYAYLNQWVFVTLIVSDGQYSVARAVAVKVTADDPPVLNQPLPDVTMFEGTTLSNRFNLNDYFADPNNDALFYSIGYAHINVTIRANHSVDFRAPPGWWGQENVTFRARDPTGAIAEDTILVTVLHVDRPPEIGPVPDLRVHYDSVYSFNLDPYLSDPDTPIPLLTVTTSDPHVNLSDHLLLILYPVSYNGTVQNVTIFASDGYFTVNRTIRVTVGSDWPPDLRLKMLDLLPFAEDTSVPNAYDLPFYFGDPDGSQLFWSSGNRSVLVTIHPNGTVDIGAEPNWYGVERVTFRAVDPEGALAEDSVWITVTPVDDAPFFRPVPVQYLYVTTAYLSLTEYLGDVDTNVTDLFLASTDSAHARIVGQGLLLNYTADMTETIQVVVGDGTLTNTTALLVVVALPPPTSTETIPAFLFWIPFPIGAAVLAAFVLYRRRQLEWAFLVTKDGLLVSSISRQSESTIDTDLLTGMLTTIMDFANKSFSEAGADRNLEGLELGEKRVAIVKAELCYLAVVYRGRTPGSLTRIMHSLLAKIEAEHRDALGTILDSSKLGDIPVLLQRLVARGSLPFVSFGERKRTGTRSNGL